MIIIRIPTPLRPYVQGQKEIEINAGTVGLALEHLIIQHPTLKPHLLDDDGNLRPYVNLFLNEEDVRDLQNESTPLSEGDRLMILPSIAGGRGIE
jgi:molybdopterin converting factor small subunit